MGYYCGIDLGNKRTSLCILEGNRRVVLEENVITSEKAFKKVLKRYKALTCVVEASPLSEWVCNVVEELGHKISIVCPRKAKRALGNQKKKTDRRDARGLAELARSGWYEAVHRKSAEARELRSYVTARRQIVESSTSLSSSIRGILRAHGVKLSVGANESTFSRKVKEASKSLPALARSGIEELLKAYELLLGQQRAMYQMLRRSTKSSDIVQRLQTIPGIGPATATVFVATIDDPNRFPDAEKVAAYIGLTPSVYQSGATEYHGRITKTGDKLLRWLLVEAAHVLLTRSATTCDLRRWGLELQEKKGVGKARVAVARRLSGIMWKIWRDGTTFYPESLRA